MIPTNYLGVSFLNPAVNQNQPIITAPLPVPVKIVYLDSVDNGGPRRANLRVFGLAKVLVRNLVVIPKRFEVELDINGVHDIALVDRIE